MWVWGGKFEGGCFRVGLGWETAVTQPSRESFAGALVTGQENASKQPLKEQFKVLVGLGCAAFAGFAYAWLRVGSDGVWAGRVG